MSAHALMFEVGDRVRGWGRVFIDADGDWLDLATGPNPIGATGI